MSNQNINVPSPEELIQIWDEAFKTFRGNSEKLKNAYGMLMLARTLGWKPTYLMHSRSTIKEYEKILNVSIKDRFPPTTELSDRSVAWTIVSKLSNFWKAVKGEYPELKTNSTELA